MSRLVPARAVYGAVLLVAPRLHGRAKLVSRLLGARHIVQAAVLVRHATPGAYRAGATVDAMHAVSMTVAAALWPRHRRLAAADAALAGAWAASDLVRA